MKGIKTRRPPVGGLLLIIPLALLVSCGGNRINTLTRKDLFTIDLGVMSDELDYYYRNDLYLPGKADLFMKDGLFYVSSSHMGKIMGFNSYGDLLFLLMNENRNPQVDWKGREGKNSNKRYASWPFTEVGQIALTGETFLVEDRADQDKSVYDEDLEVLCTQIILRFDRDGRYLNFLGREGIGGSPFPYITDIHVRENGEFLVVCPISLGQQVFWFTPEGELLFQIVISHDNLPLYEEGYWGSLTNLSYHPRDYKVHILVDYYPDDPEAIPDKSIRKIYTLDLTTQTFDRGINVPDLVLLEKGREFNYIYDLLGTTSQGTHLLLATTGRGPSHLMAISSEGKTLFTRTLQSFESPEIFSSYLMSHQGMLMALTFLEDRAPVSWWRSDKLLP